MRHLALCTLSIAAMNACAGAKVGSRDSAASVGEAVPGVNDTAIVAPARDTAAPSSAASTPLRDSAFGPVLQVDERGNVRPLTDSIKKKSSKH